MLLFKYFLEHHEVCDQDFIHVADCLERVQVMFAGLWFGGMSVGDLAHPVTMGVILGLLVGKPLGILIFVGLTVGLRFVQLPNNITWMQIFGVAYGLLGMYI